MKCGIRPIDILIKDLSNQKIGFYSEDTSKELILLSIALSFSKNKKVTIISKKDITAEIISIAYNISLLEVLGYSEKKKEQLLYKIKNQLNLEIYHPKVVFNLDHIRGSLFIINIDKILRDFTASADKVIKDYKEELLYSFSFPIISDWMNSTNYAFSSHHQNSKFLKIEAIKGSKYKNQISLPLYKNSLLKENLISKLCSCGAFSAFGESSLKKKYLHDSYCDYSK